VITNANRRKNGNGTYIANQALQWGKQMGAKRAWLQVVCDNHPATALYAKLGFNEVYRYTYRRAPGSVESV